MNESYDDKLRAYAQSALEQLLNKRAAERMARQSDACWDHRTAQRDCPNCLTDDLSPEALAADPTFDGPDFAGGRD